MLAVLGLGIGAAVVFVAAVNGIRNHLAEQRYRKAEEEASRRLLHAQQWRVSSLINERVRAAKNGHHRGPNS